MRPMRPNYSALTQKAMPLLGKEHDEDEEDECQSSSSSALGFRMAMHEVAELQARGVIAPEEENRRCAFLSLSLSRHDARNKGYYNNNDYINSHNSSSNTNSNVDVDMYAEETEELDRSYISYDSDHEDSSTMLLLPLQECCRFCSFSCFRWIFQPNGTRDSGAHSSNSMALAKRGRESTSGARRHTGGGHIHMGGPDSDAWPSPWAQPPALL